MKTRNILAFSNALASLLVLSVLFQPTAKARAGLNPPAPQLAFLGAEAETINNKPFFRISLTILNWDKFPPELFKPAPNLPPCGKNKNSARTWLNIYNAENRKYIFGYCALASPEGLKKFSYAIPKSENPPKQVYIVLMDRQTNTKYKSNCIDAWSGGQCGTQ